MKNWLLPLLLVCATANAQMVEVKDDGSTKTPPPAPATGKAKAQEYFQGRAPRQPSNDGGATPRYLALHIGSFFTSQAYKWGNGNDDDPGKLNFGLTYRMGEWVNSMDFGMRVEFTNYDLPGGDARKLSFSGMLTFPDSNSRFPLYFGGGLGVGIFIKQLDEEGPLALDYQLIAGARFLDVFENVGFMVETGLKNHLHLTSDGQFNGVFLNAGCVFAF